MTAAQLGGGVSYAVGAGGAGGFGNANGFAGGDGTSGSLIIEEYRN